MSTNTFAPGGYRFIPGMFQYSGGVAAEPGFRIERVRFRKPVPLVQGFRRIEAIIGEAGRPMTSFCACELRSPEPFSEAGFIAFNQHYVGTLADWRVYDPATKINPVARSNVCPEINKPAEPSFHAFSFTVARSERCAELRRLRQRRSAGGQGQLRQVRRAAGRHVGRRHAREGARRARRDGAADGPARLLLARGDRVAGLHGVSRSLVPRRRNRPPRRRRTRHQLALLPSARGRSRLRDGLPPRRASSG